MLRPACPKCGSSRIRRGYRRASLLVRLLGFNYMLCDHCNLEFVGFALPGTLSRKHRRRRHGPKQAARK